jgi:hypothetical protein
VAVQTFVSRTPRVARIVSVSYFIGEARSQLNLLIRAKLDA